MCCGLVTAFVVGVTAGCTKTYPGREVDAARSVVGLVFSPGDLR